MKLFEFQSKEIFSKYGIKIPSSKLIESPNEISSVYDEIALPFIIKAQVLHGGRGKAGLVKLVDNQKEAQLEAERIYNLSDSQLLIEEKISFTQEFYVSFTIDAASGKHLLMISSEGGIDIELLAKERPEKIIKYAIDPFIGLMKYEANQIVDQLELESIPAKKSLSKELVKIYKIFAREEASLVEINPLVINSDAEVIALDGKMILDDSVMYRHTAYKKTKKHYDNEIEFLAAEDGIPYIQFDGDIGMMVAGAGLANVVLDLIHYHGGTVANYLEFGGPNYRKGKKCMEMMLSTNPKCVLVVTFGTIARADVMAEGIVEAVKELKPQIPLICSTKGTGEEEAKELLASVGLELIQDTEEAVKKAIQLVKEGQ